MSNRRRTTQGRRPAKTPYRSIASQMTPAHDRAVREAADAELRGDAATALQLHRSVPMFRQSNHGDRLQVLARLGDAAPEWLLARWITVMAARAMWTGADVEAPNRALRLVVPLLYPHGIPFEQMGCTWTEQVLPFIAGRDWVVRQVGLYEMGRLRNVVRRCVSAELLDRADQVEAWCEAPMRVLRLDDPDASRPGTARVTDLTSHESVDLLDLGVGEQLPAGQCLLGRIVPTTAGPGAMFEWRPLAIPERAATVLARAPRRWLATLHHLAVARRLEPAFSHQRESALTSDLPAHVWMSLAGVPVDDHDDVDPSVVVAAATRAALALASQGADAVAPHRHRLGDLVLDAALTDEVLSRFAAPEHLRSWQRLGDVLPLVARERCLEMAMWCDASAGAAAS